MIWLLNLLITVKTASCTCIDIQALRHKWRAYSSMCLVFTKKLFLQYVFVFEGHNIQKYHRSIFGLTFAPVYPELKTCIMVWHT